MIPVSCPFPPQSRYYTGIVFLAVLLFCISAVSAASFVAAPGVTQTTSPVYMVVKPTTMMPIVITTTPTPAPTPRTTTCDAASQCLYPSEAVATWGDGGFTQTAELPCSYNANMAAAPQAKYCYKPKVSLQQTIVPATFVTQITPPPYDTVTAPVTTVPTVKQTPVLMQTSTIKPADMVTYSCSGKTPCNGTCVDTQGSDTNNCGGCGWVCPSGLTCSGGECVYTCPAGTIECQQGECIDAQNDDKNCGKCGNRCSNRQTCMGGNCVDLCSVNPSHFTSFSWADWKGINWMTPAKDQAACGSCWAEAPTGATEALYNIEGNFWYPNGYNLNLSEQALVSGCYGDHGSCTGGDHGAALDILKTQGVAEDIYMPYQSLNCVHMEGENTVCNANIVGHCSIPGACTLPNVPANRIWKITSYTRETADYAWTDSEEVTKIQKSILCKGPLTACSGNWWHCVDIVGWQGSYWDNNGGWIIRNSWGTGWGTNGYGVLKYGEPLSNNKDKQLYGDIAMDAWSVKGVYHG